MFKINLKNKQTNDINNDDVMDLNGDTHDIQVNAGRLKNKKADSGELKKYEYTNTEKLKEIVYD